MIRPGLCLRVLLWSGCLTTAGGGGRRESPPHGGATLVPPAESDPEAFCQDASMTRLLRPLIAQTTWRRWSYLILGGALMIPYGIESMFVTAASTNERHWAIQGAVFVLTFIGPMLVTGLVPAVRIIEGTAARELLDAPKVI